MKTAFLASFCLSAALVLGACTQNEGIAGMRGHDVSETIPASAIDLHNTKCAVSGDAIGDSKLVAVYQGKVYHFCCDGCPQEFKKDPAKYAKAIAADPEKFGVKKELAQ